MKTRNDYKIPSMLPVLYVAHLEQSMKRYTHCFGMSVHHSFQDDKGQICQYHLGRDDFSIILNPAASMKDNPVMKPSGNSLSLYLFVDILEDSIQKARLSGFEILEDRNRAFWGDDVVTLRDSDGYIWMVSQSREMSLLKEVDTLFC